MLVTLAGLITGMSKQAANVTLTLLVTVQVMEFLLNDIYVTEKFILYGETNSIVNGIYSFNKLRYWKQQNVYFNFFTNQIIFKIGKLSA